MSKPDAATTIIKTLKKRNTTNTILTNTILTNTIFTNPILNCTSLRSLLLYLR